MASLTVRAPVVRPAARRVQLVQQRPARMVRVLGNAPSKEAIEQAIHEAEDACKGGSTGECAAAWDTVEELSAAASHAKEADKIDNANDPLEKFCDDNPDADECRVFDD